MDLIVITDANLSVTHLLSSPGKFKLNFWIGNMPLQAASAYVSISLPPSASTNETRPRPPFPVVGLQQVPCPRLPASDVGGYSKSLAKDSPPLFRRGLQRVPSLGLPASRGEGGLQRPFYAYRWRSVFAVPAPRCQLHRPNLLCIAELPKGRPRFLTPVNNWPK